MILESQPSTIIIKHREGAKLVFKKYKEMMHLLAAYEEEIFQKWNVSISKKMTQGGICI